MSSSEEAPAEPKLEPPSSVRSAAVVLGILIIAAAVSAYTIGRGQSNNLLFLASTMLAMLAMVIAALHLHNLARRQATVKYETMLRTISKTKPKTRIRTATTTAIDAVAHRTHVNRTTASIVLIGALFLTLLSNLRWNYAASQTLLFMLIAATIVLNASTLALDYRVSHGLFGTNEREAREIVRFVLRNADDTDFSGGLGACELDLSAGAESELAAVWSGVPVYE